MNTETTTTETDAAPVSDDTAADLLELAEALRAHCDDPRGIRSELDDLASRIYHGADDLHTWPLHDNLRHLGNAVWGVVDALDRLREEAAELARDLATA